jgi:F0F1-type ATP synthase assembly protein I
VQDLAKKQAKRTLLIQVILFFSLALLALIFISVQGAYSAVLGGLATVLPASIFTACAFYHQGARAAGQILGDFYLGALLKFVSMGFLFYVFFVFLHPIGLIFMGSFMLTQIIVLVAPSLLSFYDRRRA